MVHGLDALINQHRCARCRAIVMLIDTEGGWRCVSRLAGEAKGGGDRFERRLRTDISLQHVSPEKIYCLVLMSLHVQRLLSISSSLSSFLSRAPIDDFMNDNDVYD